MPYIFLDESEQSKNSIFLIELFKRSSVLWGGFIHSL